MRKIKREKDVFKKNVLFVGSIILKIYKIYPFKVSLKPLKRLAVSKGRAFGRGPQSTKSFA